MIWARLLGRHAAAEHAPSPNAVWPMLDTGKLARPAASPADERDAAGRFVSEHRRKVREKCREQCAALGRDVPEALR